MTVRLLVGDCRRRLLELADESVQCCVTSPPYFGLRDYETGEWLGGDPECEHVVGELRRGAGLAESIHAVRGGALKAADPQPIRARRVCPHCGAERADDQIGQEATPEEYVEALVEVFRLVRQKLRPDGVLWLNLGDSYASSGGMGRGVNLLRIGRAHQQRNVRPGRTFSGIKKKDLIGIPWMVAFALRADGWWLRQDVIWAKPNPMPESVDDRCTKAHEYLFMLTKSGSPTVWRAKDSGEWSSSPDLSETIPNPTKNEKFAAKRPVVNRWRAFDYYFDADEIAEPVAESSAVRLAQNVEGQAGKTRTNGETRSDRPFKAAAGGRKWKGNNRSFRGGGVYTQGQSFHNSTPVEKETVGNDQAPGPRRGPKVSEGRKSAAAGEEVSARVEHRSSIPGGQSLELEPTGWRNRRSVWTVATLPFGEAHFATFPATLVEPCILATAPEGSIVLDPFGGAGTTALAADRLQRHAVLCELNPEYAEITERRLRRDGGLLLDLVIEPPPPEEDAA